MSTYGCGCKDTAIIEGIFEEASSESRSSEDGECRAESFTDIGAGDRLPEESASTQIKSYTMLNHNHMEVVLIDWGATIVSVKCPDKYGHSADVVLGFDDAKSYMDPTINPFIGCILGRCANRIEDGRFTLKNVDYQLSKNDLNKHHLHGGANGFGRRRWNSSIDGCSVVMTYLSDDNEEGYPGAVLATVRFKLTPDNKLEICIRATTSKPTIVNMSHGTFFNLAGHDGGEEELRQHKVSLNCDRWTFADYANPVPTGGIRGVGGTVMDLRIPKFLGACMDKVPSGGGFDHNFCVVRSSQNNSSFVASAFHVKSGRVLEVYSDQPGVQFYTGGRLGPRSAKDTTKSGESDIEGKGKMEDEMSEKVTSDLPKSTTFIVGKKGAQYKKYAAFSIQPQNYPNAINHSHFPCSVLQPGQVYCHDLFYKFGIQLSSYM